jgi:hypothetical protein
MKGDVFILKKGCSKLGRREFTCRNTHVKQWIQSFIFTERWGFNLREKIPGFNSQGSLRRADNSN